MGPLELGDGLVGDTTDPPGFDRRAGPDGRLTIVPAARDACRRTPTYDSVRPRARGAADLIGSVEATIAVLFAIVVLGPTLAERLRIAGIAGLIAGGMIFGPFVIDWLESDGLVEDLGAIGIAD